MEDFDYWADLGVVKLRVLVGFKAKSEWATEFFIEMSGFEFFYKKSLTERFGWLSMEAYKRVKITQKMIENGVDFYRFQVTVRVGEQSDTVEYEILKTTFKRWKQWQRYAMAEAKGLNLIEWDFEVKNDD